MTVRERREKIDTEYEYAKKSLNDRRYQAIVKLQKECSHPNPTHYPDPYRKSDSFYHCEECGKYWRKGESKS